MDNERLASLLREAVGQHRQGDLAQALTGYDAILAIEPDYFDALHLKGVIAAQQGHADAAIGLMRRAIAVNPQHIATHENLAKLLLQKRRLDEALASYEALVALQPDNAAALATLAQLLHMQGRLDAALGAYDRLLALKPGDAAIWYNRGNALQALGRPGLALESHSRALTLKPDEADAIYGQAIALQALSLPAEAVLRFDALLALKPDHAQALSSRGNALQALGHLEPALASHDKSIAAKPDNADAHFNRGNVLFKLDRHQEALDAYDRALALRADFAGAHGGRANALRPLGRPEEALASYDRTLALRPNDADTWSNRGGALIELLRPDEALASYERALALRPDHVDAQWNRAFTLLLTGDFERGWPAYESRRRLRDQADKRPMDKLWSPGESPNGRHVLLQSEQGMGDAIQFARYAPLVRAQGAEVTLAVHASLVRLLKTLDPAIDVVDAASDPQDFDLRASLLSLPLIFGTTLANIPAAPRYLAADPDDVETWRARLPRRTRPLIGLAWSGNPGHRNDRNRSIPLARIAPLLGFEADWIAVQRDITNNDDIATMRDLPGLALVSDNLADFADTAALIEQLDLVISVDTSVAHLAGALGKPVWLLLPFSPDWRWLTGRDDTPWYPNTRLFRQTWLGDWSEVIERVRSALSRHQFGRAS